MRAPPGAQNEAECPPPREYAVCTCGKVCAPGRGRCEKCLGDGAVCDESDTPRCYEAFACSDSDSRAEFARRLERELWIAKDLAESYRRSMNVAKEEMERQARMANIYRLELFRIRDVVSDADAAIIDSVLGQQQEQS